MTQLGNTFEGQTTGTALTTGNSGGGSGSAFDILSVAGTQTATYDSSRRAHGTNGLHITGAATSTCIPRWTVGFSGSSMAARLYVNYASIGGACDLAAFRSSASSGFPVTIGLSATGQLLVKNNAAATVKTFAALTADTWYRVEWQATKGTTTGDGFIACQYYLGDSATPVEASYSSSATNAGTTDLDEFRFGKLTSAPAADLYFDSILVDNSTASPLGPLVSGGLRSRITSLRSRIR